MSVILMKMVSTLQLHKAYLFCCMHWIKYVTDYMCSIGKVLYKHDMHGNGIQRSYRVYEFSCLFHYCYCTNLTGLVGKVLLHQGKVTTF